MHFQLDLCYFCLKNVTNNFEWLCKINENITYFKKIEKLFVFSQSIIPKSDLEIKICLECCKFIDNMCDFTENCIKNSKIYDNFRKKLILSHKTSQSVLTLDIPKLTELEIQKIKSNLNKNDEPLGIKIEIKDEISDEPTNIDYEMEQIEKFETFQYMDGEFLDGHCPNSFDIDRQEDIEVKIENNDDFVVYSGNALNEAHIETIILDDDRSIDNVAEEMDIEPSNDIFSNENNVENASSTSNNLKENAKKYICEICNKQFNRKTKLETHQKSHAFENDSEQSEDNDFSSNDQDFCDGSSSSNQSPISSPLLPSQQSDVVQSVVTNKNNIDVQNYILIVHNKNQIQAINQLQNITVNNNEFSVPLMSNTGQNGVPVLTKIGQNSASVMTNNGQNGVPVLTSTWQNGVPVLTNAGQNDVPVLTNTGQNGVPVLTNIPILPNTTQNNLPLVSNSIQNNISLLPNTGQNIPLLPSTRQKSVQLLNNEQFIAIQQLMELKSSKAAKYIPNNSPNTAHSSLRARPILPKPVLDPIPLQNNVVSSPATLNNKVTVSHTQKDPLKNYKNVDKEFFTDMILTNFKKLLSKNDLSDEQNQNNFIDLTEKSESDISLLPNNFGRTEEQVINLTNEKLILPNPVSISQDVISNSTTNSCQKQKSNLSNDSTLTTDIKNSSPTEKQNIETSNELFSQNKLINPAKKNFSYDPSSSQMLTSPVKIQTTELSTDIVSKNQLTSEFVKIDYNFFDCDLCPLSYEDLKTLNEHKSMVHGENQNPDLSSQKTNSTVTQNQMTNMSNEPSEINLTDTVKKEIDLPNYLSAENKCGPTKMTVSQAELPKRELIDLTRWRVYDEKLDKNEFLNIDFRCFKCDLCPSSFTNSKYLYDHKISSHGEKKCQCEICGAKFTTNKKLKNHKITHSNVYSHKCQICPKVFKTESKLKDHQISHDGKRIHVCETCGKSFAQRGSFRHHLLTHVENVEKKFVCKFCNAKFLNKNILDKHITMHTGEKNHECDICSKKFRLKSTLKKHFLSHSDEKHYRCKICSKDLKTKNGLNIHLNLHSNKKDFVCEICNKRFAIKTSLKLHLLSHSDELKYSCDICEKKFTAEFYMERHKKFHFNKPYTCNICNIKFTAKHNLTNHLKKHELGKIDSNGKIIKNKKSNIKNETNSNEDSDCESHESDSQMETNLSESNESENESNASQSDQNSKFDKNKSEKLENESQNKIENVELKTTDLKIADTKMEIDFELEIEKNKGVSNLEPKLEI